MTETSSPKKSGGCWLPAIGAAVLIGGGAAAYWVLNKNSGGDISAAGNATVLPDETIAIAHLNPASFDKLAEFGTPAVQAEMREFLASALAEISPDLDWDRDLKPWVGSVTLGLATPVDREQGIGEDGGESGGEASEGDEAQSYIAIGIRNKVKALQFARGLESEAGDETVKTEHAGVEITQVRPDEDDRGSTLAVVNDRLLVTESLATMRNAIDDANAAQTASEDPEFRQLLEQAEAITDPILRVYIPDTSAFAESEGIGAAGDAAEAAAENAESASIRASIATLNVAKNGLHGNIQVFFDGDRQIPELAELSDRIAAQFPEQTLLLLAGSDLARTWTQLVARAEAPDAPPEAQETLAMVREGFGSIGLDADRDVFSWLDGELAIGAFPIDSGLLQQVGLAAAAVVETSDRQTATTTLEQLATVANDRIPLPLQASDRQVGDIEVKEWTIPVPGMGSGGLFGFGWRDDRNLLFGLSSPALDAIAQPADTHLADNPAFQDVMGDLPADKAGYAYLNLAEIERRLQEIPAGLPNAVSPEALVLLGATRGFGMTLASAAPDRLSVDMSLALKRLSDTDGADPEAE